MTTKTRAACVIGYPVTHSRSPLLHGYWIAEHGLDAVYRAENVSPADIAAFLDTLSERGYVGANVTMPHKDIAFQKSLPDARAQAVGAANTLWYENNQLRSTNTDIEGFVASLDAAAPGWDTTTTEAIVLGAGGAGRAIVAGLAERGVRVVHVVNRTLANALALQERFGAIVKPETWDNLPALMERAQLLVNTTSLGMHGQPDLELDLGALPSRAVVADIVYVPLETSLLTAARARNLPTADGLDMLLHQAVGGFELWFGIRPAVTRNLYDLLARDIIPS